MLGILIASGAQILLGLSIVFDKVLLKNKWTGDPLPYVFWIGVIDAFGLLFIPFGFHFVSLSLLLLSFAAGASFFVSILWYYIALKRGEASQSVAIVGGFAPIATALIANALLGTSGNIAEKVAFVLLALGGLVMFSSEKFSLWRIAPFILLAAGFTGLTDVLEKLVFDQTNFATGFVLMKLGTVLTALTLLLIPRLRKRIRNESHDAPAKNRTFYLANRALAGVSSVLIFYAVKLEHPALVEAIGGLRYVVIFLAALALTLIKPSWLKERFRGWTLAGKIIATLLIIAGLTGLGLERYYESQPPPPAPDVSWGVNFSTLMAEHFGMDPRGTYDAILSELHPKAIRIAAYWDENEPQKGVWDFKKVDWQLEDAAKYKTPAILVVGEKTPRWPECHFPSWVDRTNLTERKTELLAYLTEIVNRYKNTPGLSLWQVENEPFLFFGECPTPDASLLDSELSLVRSIDPNHKILLTDGGEFGDWVRAASRADVFGNTLYRKVNTTLFGRITWPITPAFYPLRRDITRLLIGKPDQQFMVVELGLEPWAHKQIYEVSVDEQLSLFSIQDFESVISYARQTGFKDFYLWGAEWWYWLKTKGNHPEFWNAAKNVFKG